jgi:glycosyltransferase involved in cell wall biosynthesis
MSVHNGAEFLSEAVESILSQTYADFDFIIVDDASVDDSTQILADYAVADKRISLLRNESKRGLAASLNLALEVAAPLVVRMDADDISLPGRLTLQKKLMDEHPEVAVLGGGCGFWTNMA